MREDESRHGNVPNFDDPCEVAGRHVRAARHTWADCPITHAAERAERDHEPATDLGITDTRALDRIAEIARGDTARTLPAVALAGIRGVLAGVGR